MKLEQYLTNKHEPKTAQNYLAYIERYMSQQSNHFTASYQDIVNYIGKERKRGLYPRTLRSVLASLKKYYSYLQETKQRDDHPCKYLRLRDRIGKHIQLQDLLSEKELKLLLEKVKEARVKTITYRNQLIISLLICQALKREELLCLQVADFQQEKGTVYVKGKGRTNSRTLKLEASQMYLLQKYLYEERPKLLSRSKVETDQLIITLHGTIETGRGIPQITEALKKYIPEKKIDPVAIRQSVIANKLKNGEDLRVVQVFAGHQKMSTTERYRQTDLEQLKDEVCKYHPLQ